MHNACAVARRVLMQFCHDPRTLGVMFIAPCIVLWLFSVLLGAPSVVPRIATVNLPSDYLSYLEDESCVLTNTDATTAADLLAANSIDAILSMSSDHTLEIKVEGADVSRTAATLSAVRGALVVMQQADETQTQQRLDNLSGLIDTISTQVDPSTLSLLPSNIREPVSSFIGSMEDIINGSLTPSITGFNMSWLHGSADWTNFEFYGPVFIGIFIFVFVFLTSSMSLLTERSGGTVRRLMVTPIKSRQIVGGYLLGFGLLTLIQSIIILWACIWLIGFPNVGSLALVILITVSMAIVSLTLGLLVSGLAHTPFQVVQLMLVFVVPQILLSGIFDLSQTPSWMQAVSAIFPIYYGAEALRDVMLRGASFPDIALNLGILWGFIVVFFSLACLNFKKKRARSDHMSHEVQPSA
jgi:ABC-2 type transport system permease protein